MAMIFFQETFELHVQNPGYGQLYLAADGYTRRGAAPSPAGNSADC